MFRSARGSQAFDVPCVEHLVRGQGQKHFVLLFVFEGARRHLHDSRVQMLGPSAKAVARRGG